MLSEDLITKYKGEVLAVKNLPTIPSTLIELNQMLEAPNVSTDQIADLIAKDHVLSAKTLKMVNSPIYGFPGRIVSVRNALLLLGFNVVRGVMLSTTVFENLPPGMNKLWDHSKATSLACAEIARVLEFKNPGEYAVAGLLHDIGKVIIAVQLPQANKEIRRRIKEDDLSTYKAEQEVLGFSHAKVNGWLANTWCLPPILREAITYHHKPQSAPNYPEAAACVQLGDFLARIFQQGSGGDNQVSEITQHTFRILGTDKTKMVQVLDEVSNKFSEIFGFSF